jgi:hypothetical protein
VVNDDPERSHLLMDNLADNTAKIPIQRLDCPLDATFEDIEAILRGTPAYRSAP